LKEKIKEAEDTEDTSLNSDIEAYFKKRKEFSKNKFFIYTRIQHEKKIKQIFSFLDLIIFLNSFIYEI
jgi:hypothetical protein